MSPKVLHDYPAVLRQLQQALREGRVRMNWEDMADFAGMPRQTLRYGLRRFCGVKLLDELIKPGELDGEGEEEERESGEIQGVSVETVLKFLRERPHTLEELAEALDRGQGTTRAVLAEMLRRHYGVVMEKDRVSLPDYVPAPPVPTLYDEVKRRLTFGVISDLHLGSKAAQVSALKRFVQAACDDYGVEHMLVCGDVTAGHNVYRGQVHELYAIGADEQVESLCYALPMCENLKYHMIGGNHDYSFMRNAGLNVVTMAAGMREDFVYCGYDQAEVPLLTVDGEVLASAILWHPSGGVPYALSYRGQKMAAEVSRSELTDVVMERKPGPTVRFIFWGHLHVSDIFPHGPIWVMGPGCFEGRNGYLRAKGLEPVIQGVIVDADITERGLISGVHLHPIPFVEAEEDYHCGWVPELARKREKVETVFRVDN